MDCATCPTIIALVGVLVSLQATTGTLLSPLVVVVVTVVAAEAVIAGRPSSQRLLPAVVAVVLASIPGSGLASGIESDSVRMSTHLVLPAVGLGLYLVLHAGSAIALRRTTSIAVLTASITTVALHDDAIGRTAIGQPGAPLVSLVVLVLLVSMATASHFGRLTAARSTEGSPV